MKITFLGSGNIRSNFSYRMLQLASALQKRGHTVTIIVPSADKYNKFVAEKITELNGVTIRHPFQFKTKRAVLNLLPYLISAAYMMVKEKSDLIYIYKPTPVSAVGLFGKLFHNTPVILDMDDLGSEVMKIEGHPWYQRILVSWSENMTAYYADKIIAASSFLYEMYKNRFPYKPVYILPNGVDANWLIPLEQPLRKKRIVFMGAVNRKNILEPLFDVAPELIKKYPNLEIVIIGDGSYLSYFKDKAKALKISRAVTFTGWMNIDQLKTSLFPGDIGYSYMPLERTVLAASNMKVSQYMARGVVPLVSAMGDLPTFINNGTAGYSAVPDNLEDLKKVLLSALKDNLLHEKSIQARIRAESLYNWNTLAQGVELFLGMDNSKKIYVVTTNVPGNVGGPEIRNFHLIQTIAKQSNVTVDLFCIDADTNKKTTAELEKELAVRIHMFQHKHLSWIATLYTVLFKRIQPTVQAYKQSGIAKEFYKLCRMQLPDIVHIEQINAYYCIEQYITWLKNKGVTVVLDTHNVEAGLFEQSLELFSPIKKIAGKWLVPHLWSLEREAAKNADLLLTCSEQDADYFKRLNKNTHVIPNGVDCREFVPVKKQNKDSILFIGGMTYPPNGDAVRYYLSDIHPELRKKHPNLTVTIIGATIDWLKEQGLYTDSVKGEGFVEDIRPYLAHATIGICPIRYGSGTRLKILTYMASGLPVVATTKGAEGIEPGGGIILADTAESFIQAILDIMGNNMQYVDIAARGREFVVNNYDWQHIGKALLSIYP